MDDNVFEKSSLNTVKRLPKRGSYDKETIFGILDQHFVCYLAWEVDGQPYIIPTGFGRLGDTIYVHGSSKSRMLDDLADGRPVCMVVTHIDGLVLARSAFHHSMNYRSVVIYGHAHLVEGNEKKEALRIVSEQILPGRWDEVRLPNDIELKATTVLAIEIDSASAKVRTGPPSDDDEDYDLPIWAAVLPIRLDYDEPVIDPAMRHTLAVPPSVVNRLKKDNQDLIFMKKTMAKRKSIFEGTNKPLLDTRSFFQRQVKFFLFSFGFLAVFLSAGMIGYHLIARLDWVSAYQNATMILSGMGEIDHMPTDGAKIFSGTYALFSGIVFLSSVVVMLSPAIHRVLHIIHLDSKDDESSQQ